MGLIWARSAYPFTGISTDVGQSSLKNLRNLRNLRIVCQSLPKPLNVDLFQDNALA